MAKFVYDHSFNTVAAQRRSAVVLLGENRQEDDAGLIENIRENDRIILAVGANSRDPDGADDSHDRQVQEILPWKTAAGIIINQAASPAYIFNVHRDPQGAVLWPAKKKDYKKLAETEKGISTVTIFGDEIQLVSYKNGINIRTGRRKEVGLMDNGAGTSLIHGNNVEGLEPMVKGNSLDNHLNGKSGSTTNLQNLVFLNTLKLSILYGLMASHSHLVPQIPAGITPAVPSIQGIVAKIAETPLSAKAAIDNIMQTINNVIIDINKSMAVKGNFFSDHHQLN